MIKGLPVQVRRYDGRKWGSIISSRSKLWHVQLINQVEDNAASKTLKWTQWSRRDNELRERVSSEADAF